ncbi:Alpha-1,3-mannosyltransferase-like protein [Rhizophlyctis rosea]|uniref:Alpha-1,3/1,6-mannosyltransferase ALG2 n=1 Tax=Rhizophlyctis rosea TaxID=64517 RepID=A0AAD5SLF8_9FUNG|nr:Alpha-1,3-mannosyltransferase-like protein [Rhizophlyctis rosea]
MSKLGPLKVAFIHPDLGIGGAERLVVDAAIGLQSRGHAVTMFTSHHDPSHSFQETHDGSLTVRVHGDWLPRTTFGKGHMICALLRGIFLALSLLVANREEQYDVVFADQLSVYNPLVRFTEAKAVVNSNFTAGVFRDAFKRIKFVPKVLYPGINFDLYNNKVDEGDERVKPLISKKRFLLSINRFERKKNVALAVHAFATLRDIAPKEFADLRLVIAGGYDKRVSENVDHLRELDELASGLNIETYTLFPTSAAPPESAKIIFLPSFTEAQRTYLLANAVCLIYTPSGEHFGIVPVEAMHAKLPVIAVNSGGPKETVVDGVTGYLLPPDPDAFAAKIGQLLKDEDRRKEMGLRGLAHVKAKFSLDAFVDQLEDILGGLMEMKRPPMWKVLARCALLVGFVVPLFYFMLVQLTAEMKKGKQE